MNQQEMIERVIQIFEEQGFEVIRTDGNLLKTKNGSVKKLRVFSSEVYSVKDVSKEASSGEIIFVDEGLSKVSQKLENQVSILDSSKKDVEPDFPSFEVVGSVAIINELQDQNEEQLADRIMNHHGNVETVLLKTTERKGELRLADYQLIAGEETETVHREHGLEYLLDPTEVFFSEREATEREKVAEELSSCEQVLVMFAGIGPYPVLLASRNDCFVTAVEKNTRAVEYMRENVRRNNLDDKIRVLEEDVSEAVPQLEGEFDAVLMPSPTNAIQYLDLALQKLSQDGVVCVYGMEEGENPCEEFADRVLSKVEEAGYRGSIENFRVVSEVSPSKSKVMVLLRLEKGKS